MKQKTITVCEYSELSDGAKEKARDWYREASAGDTPDSALEDVVTVAGLLGIEIASRNWTNSYGFKGSEPKIHYCAGHVQGDYAAFEGRYRYAKGAPRAIKAYAPQDAELLRIAVALQAVQSRNFYQLTASTDCNRSSMSVSVERADDNTMTDGAEDEVTELLQDFANWIYKQILAEFDFQNSDENIEEIIIANKYEFLLESGERA